MTTQDQAAPPGNRLSVKSTLGSHVIALLAFLALISLFYAPVLLGKRTFSAGDFTDHFFPFSLFLRSELLAGRLPVWNPFTYGGHPFLADIQAGVFYPINLVFLGLSTPFTSDAARLYFLQIEAIFQIVLAGFFTYLLVRSLTGRPLAGFLAGGVFTLSGYLTGYPVLQLAILRGGIWLPLVLWLLLHAFDQPRRWRWWIAAALVYAVAFLAGHPQTFLHMSYAVLAWIALLLFKERRNRPQELSIGGYLLRIGLFYMLFVGVIAAQLLPSIEFMRLSVRASADYTFVSGGFPLADTWQALLPQLASRYSPLYVGIPALGLAVLAVGQALRAPDSASRGSVVRSAGDFRLLVAFFALLALVAWLVSYGRNAFLYPLFYRLLPGWNLFQGQERAAYLVAFGLSILAGYGGAALDVVSPRQRRLVALAYGAVVVTGIAVFLVGYQAAGWTAASPAQVGLTVVAALVALGMFVAVLWPAGLARWRLPLVTLLALAQLFVVNRGVNSDAVPLAEQAALPTGALAVQQAVMEQGNVAATVGPLAYQGPPGRVYNEHQIFEDYGMRAGVEELWGSSPLRLSRTAALLEDFPQDRLWQLMGVQHVLNSLPALYQPAEPLAEFPGPDGASHLHRLEQANPRAWVVQTVQSVNDDAALPLLGDASFEPATTALLPPVTDTDGRAGLAAEGLLALPGQNAVKMEQIAPGRLRFDVQSEHGGLLVVSENWMPGWQATIRQTSDGAAAPAPVVRADFALLGVPIDPGESIVDLAYRPKSVRSGIAISVVTLLLLVLAVVVARLRRDKAQASRAQRIVAAVILALVVIGAIVLMLRTFEGRANSTTIGRQQLAAALDHYSASLPAEKVRIAQDYPDSDLWRYYQGNVDHLVLPPVRDDPAATVQEIDRLIKEGVQRIVLASQPAGEWDSTGVAQQAISQRYSLLATRQEADWTVQIYARPPDALQPLDEIFVHPGSDMSSAISLTGAEVPAQSLAPGDVLDIYLQWNGPAEALAGSEKVTLQLLDEAGRLAAQSDQPLAASDLGAPATSYTLLIPWQLPAGAYRLIAAVYDPGLDGAPRLQTATGNDHVELAVLRN